MQTRRVQLLAHMSGGGVSGAHQDSVEVCESREDSRIAVVGREGLIARIEWSRWFET